MYADLLNQHDTGEKNPANNSHTVDNINSFTKTKQIVYSITGPVPQAIIVSHLFLCCYVEELQGFPFHYKG